MSPTIAEVKWVGLRCRVIALGLEQGSSVDLRLSWKDARSSIVTTPKVIDSAGHASLVVPDDSYEGSAVAVVLHDPEGAVVARAATTVGGDE
jgi:hypothetical protein